MKEQQQQQQQQQQLELERAWDQEREIKGNGSTSPTSDHRVQEHSPPPATDAQKNINAAQPVSQVYIDQSKLFKVFFSLYFHLQSQSTPQMMSSPVSGLHHMQQLLQQQVLSPTQLQTLMKQHSLLQQQQQQQVSIYFFIRYSIKSMPFSFSAKIN